MMVLLGTDKSLAASLASGDFAALASDLADHAVRAASQAVYQAEALSKLPASLVDTWCEQGPDATQVVISKKLRDLIRFRRLNLLGQWPISSAFDVIFCRNVMIYFDEPTKEALVLRLVQALKPGGHLYIGHSERVSGEAAQYVESLGSTIYKRKAP
jgi:chemotaxis protein methyltransferase CheR